MRQIRFWQFFKFSLLGHTALFPVIILGLVVNQLFVETKDFSGYPPFRLSTHVLGPALILFFFLATPSFLLSLLPAKALLSKGRFRLGIALSFGSCIGFVSTFLVTTWLVWPSRRDLYSAPSWGEAILLSIQNGSLGATMGLCAWVWVWYFAKRSFPEIAANSLSWVRDGPWVPIGCSFPFLVHVALVVGFLVPH